jgi:hypothetical protein
MIEMLMSRMPGRESEARMLMVSPIVSKLVAEDIARDAEATAARMRMLDEAREASGEAHPVGQARRGVARFARHLSPVRRLVQPAGVPARCQADTV